MITRYIQALTYTAESGKAYETELTENETLIHNLKTQLQSAAEAVDMSKQQMEVMQINWQERIATIATIETTYHEMSANLAELEAELERKEGIEGSLRINQDKLKRTLKEKEELETKLQALVSRTQTLELEIKQIREGQKAGDLGKDITESLGGNVGRRGGTLIQTIRDKIKGQESEISKFLKDTKNKDDMKFSRSILHQN